MSDIVLATVLGALVAAAWFLSPQRQRTDARSELAALVAINTTCGLLFFLAIAAISR